MKKDVTFLHLGEVMPESLNYEKKILTMIQYVSFSAKESQKQNNPAAIVAYDTDHNCFTLILCTYLMCVVLAGYLASSI